MKTSYDEVPNVPKIQKGVPNKFARPGINLARPEKREWKDIEAAKVCIGDTVVDVGQIAAIIHGSNWARLENIAGDRTQFDASHVVKAFVRVV